MAILSAINFAVFLFWMMWRPEGVHIMPWAFWVPILILDLVSIVHEFTKPSPSAFGIGLQVFGLLAMFLYFAPYLTP
jgi:hypothetical protein